MTPEELSAAIRQAEWCERQGRFAEAIELYRRVLAARPNEALVWNFLGVATFNGGDPAAAITAYERAIELDPRKMEPHYNLGCALRVTGEIIRAIASLRTAVELRPNDPRPWNKLGSALLDGGLPTEACEAFQTMLRLQPTSGDAFANLGACLLQLGRLPEAARCLNRAVALDPKNFSAWNNWGTLHQRTKDWSAAERCFTQAIALAPRQAELHSNLGAVHASRLDYSAAEACYRRAIAVRPNYATAHYNLGLALQSLGRFDEAAESYERALECRPNYAEARYQHCTLRMLRGDLAGGYADFARRWELPAAGTRRVLSQPTWDGGDLRDRTILLYAEQGYGDLFQFVRFTRQVQAHGARVLLECRPEVIPLLQSAPGVNQFIAKGSALPPFDCHAALMDLPAILRMTLETIPAQTPYLFADPALVGHWRQALGPGFKVGIVWQGSPTYLRDASRSVPLREFLPLTRVPNVRLIALQRGAGTEQLHGLPPGTCLETLPDDIDTTAGAFTDTAAVMHNLDLIITSDTSAAHLAGALGRPVWTALGVAPDWRWFLEREDSPWYPTMRLFRRSFHGDWAEVFGRMANELAKLAGADR